jgi:type I restriction enzyme M protein
LVLKKKREQEGAERSRSVLFIDASQHFEKVKTQNVLRPDDIHKIISTYKAYASGSLSEAEVTKYSHVAPLSEIAENDYNLNIPRYVDTFEEEEAVDLKAVSKELRAVAERSRSTDAVIADFCRELGIDTPF